MSNGKQFIHKNLKVKIWVNNFKNNLEGKCHYCNCSILIPKVVKNVLYPNIDLNEYENLISDPIYGTHFDHIISEYNNGYTNEENLRPICILCNLKKGNKNEEDFVVNLENKKKNDFMDIDVEIHKCNGLIFKNGFSILCKKNSYFRNKCIHHLHQRTKY